MKTTLLQMGYAQLDLRGALLDDARMDAVLFVEDDAEFLAAAASDVELLHQAGGPYHHEVTLGDGQLTIAASSDAGQVAVKFALFPQLNAANRVEHEVVLSRDQYVWWWRSLARQLEVLAGIGRAR
ncbi:hypothetical protein [Geodermatophilus pulveris]|uniref:hypothetical protein n=1 Tax=Geodermatophilus pulveris TaxID=1564159 RepID=UPI000B79458B|nr:hypothetical protein [Geodermatophilus pulveris]